MTVQQLIESLSMVPQNSEVLIGSDEILDADCPVSVARRCNLIVIEHGAVTLQTSKTVMVFAAFVSLESLPIE